MVAWGRLAGAGFNAPQASLIKGQGGERQVQDPDEWDQLWIRETSAGNHSMRCRKSKENVKTGLYLYTRTSLGATCLLPGWLAENGSLNLIEGEKGRRKSLPLEFLQRTEI